MRLAVTLGDPAGIGPEVTELALRTFLARSQAEIVLVGADGVADAMAARLGVTSMTCGPFLGPPAQASKESGAMALACLARAIDMAKRGEVHGLVTAPISKTALALAGSKDLGHTEILARELAVGPVAMAFYTERLRVVLATVHIPLRQVFKGLSTERVIQVATLLDESLRRDLRFAKPRLALAGLNPHAGEGGLLGDEDETLLVPAIEQCRARGIDLQGPLPPDTIFRRAVDGEFDGVVALYHDQGLIPVKLLAFGEAVNVTLGLKVPRTSPDHGTAYDKVGTGLGRPDGMLGALDMAQVLSMGRRSLDTTL